MSESTDKILTSERPNNDEGWIEYALSLGWEELPMGYEYVTNNAATELSALRAEVEKNREIIADANELLWEFTENPNIEMGEVGHQKIEDYFKKYSLNV